METKDQLADALESAQNGETVHGRLPEENGFYLHYYTTTQPRQFIVRIGHDDYPLNKRTNTFTKNRLSATVLEVTGTRPFPKSGELHAAVTLPPNVPETS